MALAVSGLVALAAASAEEPTVPAESGLTEQVEVRLVLIDALVTDREGRAVPGLVLDDFELFLDFERVPVDTLDVRCAEAPGEQASAIEDAGRGEPSVSAVERRIVLVLDYMHLAHVQRPEVIDHLRAMIRDSASTAEETMLAAIVGRLRVEQLFTRDREELLASLERMEHDITLWEPRFDHRHELSFFGALEDLLVLLNTLPGSKAVVLFSTLTGPAHAGYPNMRTLGYDERFDRVAALAATARAALYPVDARGLAHGGTLSRLARLAADTGGRFTEGTNDLAVGYARAQRDLACRYTLGFYDREPRRERTHRVVLKCRRPGLRVSHPAAYRFRSSRERRNALARTAHLAPEMFSRGASLRTGLLRFRPAGRDRWNATLAESLLLDLGANEETEREVGLALTSGNTVWREVRRRFGLRGDRARSARPTTATFLQGTTIGPGDYRLSAVVTEPGAERPEAALARVVIPAVPKAGAFVVGPFLGRRGDGAILARRLDRRDSRQVAEWRPLIEPGGFEPLLGDTFDPHDRLVALTEVCTTEPNVDGVIRRALLREDGHTERALPDAALGFDRRGKLRCRSLLDELPTDDLAPGAYVLEVSLVTEPPGEPVGARARFTLAVNP